MLNISLPDQIRSFIEEQAKASGVESPNEYVYHLILHEQKRISQQQQIESLLIEGLESGDAVEVTEDWWNQKRTQLANRFQPTDS